MRYRFEEVYIIQTTYLILLDLYELRKRVDYQNEKMISRLPSNISWENLNF